jgi:hypothetical protein
MYVPFGAQNAKTIAEIQVIQHYTQASISPKQLDFGWQPIATARNPSMSVPYGAFILE